MGRPATPFIADNGLAGAGRYSSGLPVQVAEVLERSARQDVPLHVPEAPLDGSLACQEHRFSAHDDLVEVYWLRATYTSEPQLCGRIHPVQPTEHRRARVRAHRRRSVQRSSPEKMAFPKDARALGRVPQQQQACATTGFAYAFPRDGGTVPEHRAGRRRCCQGTQVTLGVRLGEGQRPLLVSANAFAWPGRDIEDHATLPKREP